MSALLLRDMRLAIRAGGGFVLSLAFFLIVVVLVPFGVGPEMGLLSKIAPGILWVGALLACLLSLDRIFALDFEDGTLDLLATAPLPPGGGRCEIIGPLDHHGPARLVLVRTRFGGSYWATIRCVLLDCPVAPGHTCA